MANVRCGSLLQGKVLRVTKLDECGFPDYGACGFGVSDGFVQVVLTPEVEDGEDFLTRNAAGRAVINARSAPTLRWYTVSMEFVEVDPEIFNIITGNLPYLNDATPTAQTAGYFSTEAEYAAGNFALELWAGDAEGACTGLAPWYGYQLLPWVVEGAIAAEDITFANAAITFTLSGRTRSGTPWGTGPYDVVLDNTGTPSPLITAAPDDLHFASLWTQLAPPTPECGCQELTS